MARINFSDNVEARGRNLHLQTNTLDENNHMVSTLFDGGRVLAKEDKVYQEDLADDALQNEVMIFHADRKESIERLYLISARVKTMRHAQSMHMLGCLFLKWHLIDEAISEFEYALNQDDQYGDAYLNLGRAYILRGGFQEAIEILQKGRNIATNYPDIQAELGYAYLLNHQHKEAIDMLEAALKINASYADVHYLLALVFFYRFLHEESGQDDNIEHFKDRTIEHLNRAVSLSKRYRIKAVGEGVLFIKRGEFEAGYRKLLDTQEKIGPELDKTFHYEFYLNFLYGQDGRNHKYLDQYRATLEQLLREHPDYPDLHNYLGVTSLIQSREHINRAIHEFRTANQLNPEYQEAARNLKLTENDGKGFLLLLRAVLR
ncbi:tetratricopeptide repeat protein [candidate division KSB1 bacterium]|nr:tetratricopeptide repeat protein [candidate division KSB1 bacterium]